MHDIFIAAIKLALGLLAFLIVGYVGKLYDKRIAGALLTFPILNAIGILSGSATPRPGARPQGRGGIGLARKCYLIPIVRTASAAAEARFSTPSLA